MGRLEILCTRFRHTPFRSTASRLVRAITARSRHVFTRLRDRQEIRIYTSGQRAHSVTRKTRKKRRTRNTFENFPVTPNRDDFLLFREFHARIISVIVSSFLILGNRVSTGNPFIV